MNPADWSVVEPDEEPGYFHDHDDEPWMVSTEHLPWEWESRRLSLRVLILCGAALVTIAAIAWVTTGGSPK